LVAEALREIDFSVRILPPDVFYPIDYFRFHQLVAAGRWPTESHSVHLWNSRWRREGLDPDAHYRPDCLYERLKRTHRVMSPVGSPRGDGGLLGHTPHFVRKLVTRMRRVRRPRHCLPGLPA
jgi:hypothetical protein